MLPRGWPAAASPSTIAFNCVVRGKKFATRCGDLDSDSILRSDERRPCFGHVGLASRSRYKLIHHVMDDARVCLVIFDRGRIMHGIHDRRRRRGLRSLRRRRSDSAKEKQRYVSHRQNGFTTANGLYE